MLSEEEGGVNIVKRMYTGKGRWRRGRRGVGEAVKWWRADYAAVLLATACRQIRSLRDNLSLR